MLDGGQQPIEDAGNLGFGGAGAGQAAGVAPGEVGERGGNHRQVCPRKIDSNAGICALVDAAHTGSQVDADPPQDHPFGTSGLCELRVDATNPQVRGLLLQEI